MNESPRPTTRQEQAKAARAERARKNAETLAALPPGQRLAVNIVSALLLISGALLLIWLFWGCGSSTSSPASTPLAAIGEYTALVKCEGEARRQLRDPSSAQFPDSGLPQWNGQTWNHAGEITGENAFGARVQTSYLCEISGTVQLNSVTTVTLLQ